MLVNQAKGNAFRDSVSNFLESQGRTVQKEVVKQTPFGVRVIDIEVSDTRGNILGGVETKTGGSRYTPSQRAKDAYLRASGGYNVNVVRDK